MNPYRILMFSAVMTAAMSSSSPWAEIKIMPLGDSITYRSGKDEKSKVQNYRYPLFKLLVDNNIDFDYVGRNKDEYLTKWPGDYPDYEGVAFDGDNEGYRGQLYATIINKLQSVPASMAPDWLLCYAGANDVREGKMPKDACVNLFAAARSKNPKVVIFLGLLASCAGSSTLDQLNDAQVQYCKEHSTAQSPIYAVDFGSVQTADGCHVSAAGAQTMANGWMKAINAHLASQGATRVLSPVSSRPLVVHQNTSYRIYSSLGRLMPGGANAARVRLILRAGTPLVVSRVK